MNFIKTTDENQLKEVILHYKKYYLSLGIIIVSAILSFFVILPQFYQYTDQQSEINEIEKRIGILKKNLQYIATINDEIQSQDIAVTTQALPGEKDYAGILNAIRTASSKSGVSLGDFTFTVGDLSGEGNSTKSTPVISMDLNVIGDLKDLSLFLSELAKLFPLSEISEMSVSNKSTQLVVNFYYKPIRTLKVNYTRPISPITGVNQKLLETLRGWQTDNPSFDLSVPIEASNAASPF